MATNNEMGRLPDAKRLITSKGVGDASTPERASTSEAIRYFMQSAQQQEYYTTTGLDLFKNSLDAAKQEISREYQNAIATLKPQQQSSRTALDELMRFVGINPTPATTGMADQLKGLNTRVDTSNLNSLIQRAEMEKDPTKRAALKEQINTAFEQTKGLYQQDLQKQLSQQSLPEPKYLAPAGQAPVWNNPKYANVYAASTYGGTEGKAAVEAFNKEMADYNAKVQQAQQLYQNQLSEYNRQKSQMVNEAQTSYNESLNTLKDIQNQFTNQYTPEFDKAYTGQEVTQKLEATPGYQFQMNQGTKAIERQGAARGMLGSGNTLLALQQFGQDLASNFYSQHIQNLGNIAQLGSGAAGQIANLYKEKGGLLANIYQQKGAASQEAFNTIGQAYSNAYTRSGEIEAQASQAYADQKFAAKESAKTRAMSVAQSILQNEPAMRQLDQAAGAAAGMAAAAEEAKREDKKAAQEERGLLRDSQTPGLVTKDGITWWKGNGADPNASSASPQLSASGGGTSSGGASGGSSSGGGASV